MGATVTDQTATFLNIEGSGIIRGNRFEDTFARWAFTVQNAGGNHDFFSFSANSATGVPDGGTAVALLGMGQKPQDYSGGLAPLARRLGGICLYKKAHGLPTQAFLSHPPQDDKPPKILRGD